MGVTIFILCKYLVPLKIELKNLNIIEPQRRKKFCETVKRIPRILKMSNMEKVEKLQQKQKVQQKTLVQRQTLDSQLNENKLVKEEIDRLEDDARVFKLIGPALVKQDTSEAKQNVDKRIDYISGELKRHDEMLAALDKEQDELRSELQNMQTNMQKLAQA